MISLKLLNKKEREDIGTKIQELIQDKSIYPIIVITKESDPYPGAVLRATLLFALIISFIFLYFLSFQFDFLYLLLPFLVTLLILPLTRILNLKRFALSKGEVLREVSEKAYESFYRYTIDKNQLADQVMIFVSESEKRFEIMFGKNIHPEIKDSLKEEIAQNFQAHYQKKEYAEGFKKVLLLIHEKMIQRPLEGEIEVKNRIFQE